VRTGAPNLYARRFPRQEASPARKRNPRRAPPFSFGRRSSGTGTTSGCSRWRKPARLTLEFFATLYRYAWGVGPAERSSSSFEWRIVFASKPCVVNAFSGAPWSTKPFRAASPTGSEPDVEMIPCVGLFPGPRAASDWATRSAPARHQTTSPARARSCCPRWDPCPPAQGLHGAPARHRRALLEGAGAGYRRARAFSE
jgi:hypothetical protein